MFEDGVGIICSFVDDWKRAERAGLVERCAAALRAADARVHYVAGCATRHFLGPLIDASPLKGLLIPLFVKNEFFGGNVDVTGLLCGCDMADAVRAERERGLQLALIPRVVFNDDSVTLDDMSLEDMEKRAGARMSVVSCNASDYLLEIIHLVGRTDPTS